MHQVNAKSREPDGRYKHEDIIFLKINNSSQNDHMQHIVRNYVGVITYSVVNQNHSIPYQLQLVM